MTAEGICFEKGDYLAWEDMEWVLHGQARIGIIDHEVTCKRKSYTNLFYARFQDWETCMRHCKKLGSRVPSVSNFHDWLKLQKSLKEAKVLNTMYFWLPISDRRKEGEWRDFYTGDVIQNYTHPWIRSEANGGNEQNCVDLEENGWADAYCSDPNRACVCTQDPEIHLDLKGYMPNTMIDRYYKLTSDYQDKRKMIFQGLTGTSITYDYEAELWVGNMADSNISITSSALHASFILGKHN